MNAQHFSRVVLLTLCLLPLAACSGPTNSSDGTLASGLNSVASKIRDASDKVREEIRTGDIDLSSDDADAPKAVITPQGELVIDGKKVQTNPVQDALLRDYRQQIEEIAEAGADIGLKGAGVAMTAVGEALKGAFSGASEADIERSIEAQASGLKQEASRLCDRLPAFIATQDKLAAALPEFAPYANADMDDVADCRSDTDGASVTSARQ
ncbi:DUF2884 family protein [Lysobacter sp. A03]|uniref:DUF2884 family protein n=1 Tax=Lysobacter sp. A03 TaxID=1199154 RepID=UPI0005B6BD26|nr:DUF2884 family protein [Lysobacter sp. A03]KIQ95937.1 hypothetical protein TI01_2595 [Lysobacter sp. A03]